MIDVDLIDVDWIYVELIYVEWIYVDLIDVDHCWLKDCLTFSRPIRRKTLEFVVDYQ